MLLTNLLHCIPNVPHCSDSAHHCDVHLAVYMPAPNFVTHRVSNLLTTCIPNRPCLLLRLVRLPVLLQLLLLLQLHLLLHLLLKLLLLWVLGSFEAGMRQVRTSPFSLGGGAECLAHIAETIIRIAACASCYN